MEGGMIGRKKQMKDGAWRGAQNRLNEWKQNEKEESYTR